MYKTQPFTKQGSPMNKGFKLILAYLALSMRRVIRFRNWLMHRGTNLVQVGNISASATFLYIFGFNDSGVSTAPSYSAFVPFDESRWWLVFPLIMVLQLLFLLVKSVRCGVLAGFILLLSVPVWTFVSIMFANSGVANTATFIYAGIAISCFLGGWRLVDFYDFKLLVKKKGSDYARGVTTRTQQPDNAPSDCCNARRIDGVACSGGKKDKD